MYALNKMGRVKEDTGDPSYGDPFKPNDPVQTMGPFTVTSPEDLNPGIEIPNDPIPNTGLPNTGLPNTTLPNPNVPDTSTGTSPFNLANLLRIFQGYNDNRNVQDTQDQINTYMNRGIPVSQDQRNAAQTRYAGLQSGSINASTDPAFLANLGLRDENLTRTMNAHGMNLSGNEVGALSQQDLAAYSDWRDRELTRSQQDSGYNFNPGPVASAGMTSAAFMAAMREARNSSLFASLQRAMKPNAPANTTTINNGPGNTNQPNTNRPNTNNPLGNPNDPSTYWRNDPGNNTWTGNPNPYGGPDGTYQSWNDPNYVPPDPTNPDWLDPNNTIPDLSGLNFDNYDYGNMDLSGYDFGGLGEW